MITYCNYTPFEAQNFAYWLQLKKLLGLGGNTNIYPWVGLKGIQEYYLTADSKSY